jgi:hypothetical protein
VNELLKKIEEFEKVLVKNSASRKPSISNDIISQDSASINTNMIPQLSLISSTNKSIDQLDQNSTINRIKIPTKHFSTPSLGEISNDSDVFSTKTHISIVPSLEQTRRMNFIIQLLYSINSLDINDSIEIKDWSPDQCIQWLTAQQMTSLIPLFLIRNINGEKLLLLDGTKMKVNFFSICLLHIDLPRSRLWV